GERLRVALVSRLPEREEPAFAPEDEPRGFQSGAVGAGLQPWALFSLHEAFRVARGESIVAPPVYVFDEPERHLHPLAQREAAEFLAQIVADGGNLVVATHAPAFL